MSIIKKIAFFMTLCVGAFSVNASSSLTLAEIFKKEHKSGLFYKQDNFGNIWPTVMGIEPLILTSVLNVFVQQFKEQEKGNAILIQLPIENWDKSNSIKKAGFILHHADNNGAQWKIQNDSPMPDPFTAIGGARVIALRKGLTNFYLEALFIEDKNLPGRLMFPGGSNDRNELILQTAQRELREEVGLRVNIEDLIPIAIINRVGGNRYGANDHNYHFITWGAQGEVKTQDSEITWAGWARLDQIIEKEELVINEQKTLKPSAVTLKIIEHINSGAIQSRSVEMLDLRQARLSKEQQDSKDKMHLYLMARPSSQSHVLIDEPLSRRGRVSSPNMDRLGD